MDVSRVRADIEAAVASERETGAFRGLVEEASGSAEVADRAVEALSRFVIGAPGLLEAMVESAQAAGVLESVAPIFETALSYTAEDLDFIPDGVGLAGVLDDAYLIYGLMQEIGDRHGLPGSELVPPETAGLMGDVKRLIGDPTATRLEMAIVAFARRRDVKATIEQITRRTGGDGLEMPSSVKMPGAASPLADVPDLALGERWR